MAMRKLRQTKPGYTLSRKMSKYLKKERDARRERAESRVEHSLPRNDALLPLPLSLSLKAANNDVTTSWSRLTSVPDYRIPSSVISALREAERFSRCTMRRLRQCAIQRTTSQMVSPFRPGQAVFFDLPRCAEPRERRQAAAAGTAGREDGAARHRRHPAIRRRRDDSCATGGQGGGRHQVLCRRHRRLHRRRVHGEWATSLFAAGHTCLRAKVVRVRSD